MKLEYQCQEAITAGGVIAPYKKISSLRTALSLCTFPSGHDAAVVFELNDKVLLNQNDAYLTDSVLEKLKDKFPIIDLWLCQFSLAGYYANRDDSTELYQKGTRYHMDSFLKYQNYLCPKMSVPFASFIYFCKYYNKLTNFGCRKD